jgi:hypothetical protein
LQAAIEARELPCWVDEHAARWVDWESVHLWWWDRVSGDEQDRYWDTPEAAALDKPTSQRTRRRASSSS